MKAPKDTRILVVDDEVYMREIVAFDLERRGYQVLHAAGGVAALKVVQSEQPDLVISDVRMPAGSGLELLTWIKERNPSTPSFIFMTAFSDISADDAMDRGAEAFLTKPLVRDSMLEEVQKALVERSERWTSPLTLDGIRKITAAPDEWEADGGRERIRLGSGGAFIEMDTGFPESLEIVEFALSVGGAEAWTLEGFGRVRWVRHERSGDRPAGIGLEFLSLTTESRAKYLEYLQINQPKAYVPLGV